MHRTRLVRVTFVLLFTTAFVSSAAAQPGLLRKLDSPARTRALLSTGRSHVIISAPDTGRNVMWGSKCDGNDRQTDCSIVASGVVVGADDGHTVVWGTSCSDPSCTPVIWNTP
jgi:hypothetical protein